ncbi:MAG: PA0069 family radical SAM protein [Alphaproteobacteria bacterium]|nr:PA0069 family radical SAM protein [Alphaproteobacteria bacterium]
MSDPVVPDRPVKGRGAVSNPTGRFEPAVRQRIDDGWEHREEDDLPPPRTTVQVDATRTILARNDSPDIGFDRSINAYRGCEHGCVYCFARPTHAYFGLSSGLDFETRIFIKPDAPRLLEAELRKKGYDPAPIAMGTNTDPYQPLEREHRITRGVLEVLRAFRHPFTIVTKGHLVTRDLDILGPMGKENLCRVGLSVTTLDRDLARKMEPRASTPAKRIEAIRLLAEAGVPAGVMAAPMIPALNDMELERILEAAADAGAVWAAHTVLRLPHEIKDLMREWLEAHAPLKAKHVLSLVREMRGGKLNDPNFGSRMRGEGAYAEALSLRARLAKKRLGLDRKLPPLDCSKFARPARAGDQLALL